MPVEFVGYPIGMALKPGFNYECPEVAVVDI